MATNGSCTLHFGRPTVVGRNGIVSGGSVREQRLAESFRHDPSAYDILYLSSSTIPPGAWREVLRGKLRGRRFIWNQDGVGYPGWAGSAYRRVNRKLKRAFRHADHVIFQSKFCQASSSRFVGEPRNGSTVLPNAVDVHRFTPGSPQQRAPRILLGGNQYERYRLESGLRAFASFSKSEPNAELIVTGTIAWSNDPTNDQNQAHQWCSELGIHNKVRWRGSFTQEEAPRVYQEADLMLHTKYKDPCPSAVIEAMATGTPVVYSDSGGVPELVGDQAGVPIPVEDTWDRQVPVDPEAAAEALHKAFDQIGPMRKAARARAEANHDLGRYIARHQEIFEQVLSA